LHDVKLVCLREPYFRLITLCCTVVAFRAKTSHASTPRRGVGVDHTSYGIGYLNCSCRRVSKFPSGTKTSDTAFYLNKQINNKYKLISEVAIHIPVIDFHLSASQKETDGVHEVEGNVT